MEDIGLSAQLREETGKGAAKRLRNEGSLPAILYGPDIKENLNLSLDAKNLGQILHGGAAANRMVSLTIEGAGENNPRTVMFKEIRRHPVKESLLHVDLIEVRMDETVTVEVPIVIVGKSPGVAEGGILQQELRSIEVTCLPGNIPGTIEIDISALEMGNAVHVSDVTLPEGVEASTDGDHAVVSIVAPAAEEEVKTAEEIAEELAGSFGTEEGEEEGSE